MDKKIIREIKSNLDYMSGVERKIAELILTDAKRFTAYSLQELSNLAGVSQGSIVNFANKYAGGGFPALKLAVAACVPMVEELKADGIKQTLKSFTDGACTAFKNTAALNDEKTLLSVAQKIINAKKVEIYGVYRSAVVATDFYYQLLQMGIPANFISDVLTCAVSASLLDKESLVIAISSSGQTKDVIDAVKLAKANSVSVVCITGNKNSPLAKLSDEVLVAAPSGESVYDSNTEIRLSQLLLTDTVCEYIVKSSKERSESFKLMNKILNSHSVEH
ncbi:MAG: MurR/RpiR family transcriptional regulator [Clostridia bacterium]|nr:MurR/RpiR family transcriptional regulator [Clostridia bacterium]